MHAGHKLQHPYLGFPQGIGQARGCIEGNVKLCFTGPYAREKYVDCRLVSSSSSAFIPKFAEQIHRKQ